MSHFLLVASSAWGLCKPLIQLALHLLQRKAGLRITLLLPDYRKKIIRDLLREFPVGWYTDKRLSIRYYGEVIVLTGSHDPIARVNAAWPELSALMDELYDVSERCRSKTHVKLVEQDPSPRTTAQRHCRRFDD